MAEDSLLTKRAGVRLGLRLLGLAVDGSAEAERLRALGKRALPPYPGENLIKPIVVPPPPLLPAITDLIGYDICVARVAACYRGALLERFGLHSAFLSTGPRSNKSHYLKLSRVVDLMTAFEVPPAAWVLFSFDVWKEYGATDGPPTVAWTFSEKRLIENRAWFENRRDQYFGGRVYYAEEHIALVKQWKLMWDHLMIHRPQTREELLRIVEAFFPNDSYEKGVALAQASSRRLEKYLMEAIEDGRMVW